MSSPLRDQIKEMIRQGCTCTPPVICSMVQWTEHELPIYTFRHRSGCPYMRVETAPQLALTPLQLPDTTENRQGT